MSSVLGWDTETHLIGPQKVAPPVVCATAAFEDESMIAKPGDVEWDEIVDPIFDTSTDIVRAAHNLSFDLGVMAAHDPDLLPAIFELLLTDRMHCTMIREKLLNLTQFGSIDTIPAGNTLDESEWVKVRYNLAALVMQYIGEDISGGKKGDDVWRLNYAELEDVPLHKWPDEAVEYALSDAVWCVAVYEAQETRRQQIIEEYGVDPFETLNFRCAAAFCLHLWTCWGMAVDPEEVHRVEEMLAEALSYDNMPHLIQSGILRPAKEPRPYANGATNEDGTPKMTKGSKESINTTKLKALIEKVCAENDIEVKRTKPSDRHPEGQVSASSEVLEDLHHLDDALDEYRNRQALQKLVTTELPRMRWEGEVAPVVHPCYDVLKRTGRTSSFAVDTYPSFNCQNVDPRARNCFIARPGFVLFSVDYNQMELGTLAQVCLNLFGHSVLADKINAGCDLHGYLGAQLARTLDPDHMAYPSDPDECYEVFMGMKHHEDEEQRKWWKHFRTFAKPTGLGYPGGLGPKTFVKYAKATYGIVVDLETAELLRDVWKDTFPEMHEYFEFINQNMEDPKFSGEDWDERRYAYTTPYGMLRPNCDYCAAANGNGLQSPSAEGALTGVINVTRACYDPTVGSILGPDDGGMPVRPICFIHDEQVGELREDGLMHERAMEIAALMTEGMRQVTPDVASRAEPALMRRWDKRAEPVYDENGRLTIWTPDEE